MLDIFIVWWHTVQVTFLRTFADILLTVENYGLPLASEEYITRLYVAALDIEIKHGYVVFDPKADVSESLYISKEDYFKKYGKESDV